MEKNKLVYAEAAVHVDVDGAGFFPRIPVHASLRHRVLSGPSDRNGENITAPRYVLPRMTDNPQPM